MAEDNVTRIHPAPSIPNPLLNNVLWSLTDDELGHSLAVADARLDAVKHTERSLRYERARRESVKEALAYIDKSLDNVADLAPDLPWRNEEVIEVLRDVRALLMPTSPDSGPCGSPMAAGSDLGQAEGGTGVSPGASTSVEEEPLSSSP